MNATAQLLGALAIATAAVLANSRREYAVFNTVTGILLRTGSKRECARYLKNDVSSSYKARFSYSVEPTGEPLVPAAAIH